MDWIPFEVRKPDAEELEMHPDWCFVVDSQLPEDGDRILVSVSMKGHEFVQYDEFCHDDYIYLDSGYEIGTEALAWMPLPEPYKPERGVG